MLGLNELSSVMTSPPSVRTVLHSVGGRTIGVFGKTSDMIDEIFSLTKFKQDAKLPLFVPIQVSLLLAIAFFSDASLQLTG